MELKCLSLFLVFILQLTAEEIEPALCLLQTGLHVQRPSVDSQPLVERQLAELDKLASSFGPATPIHIDNTATDYAVGAPLGRGTARDIEMTKEALADSVRMFDRAMQPVLGSTGSALEATEAATAGWYHHDGLQNPARTALIDKLRKANVPDLTKTVSTKSDAVPEQVVAEPDAQGEELDALSQAYYNVLGSLGLKDHAISASGFLALIVFEGSFCLLCCLCAAVGIANDNTEEDMTPWYCDPCVEVGQCCVSSCNPAANPYIVGFFCMYGIIMNIIFVVYAGVEANKMKSTLIVYTFVCFLILGALFGLTMMCSKQLKRLPGYKKFAELPDVLDDVTDFLGITECSSDDEQSMFQYMKHPCGKPKTQDPKEQKKIAVKDQKRAAAKRSAERKKSTAANQWF